MTAIVLGWAHMAVIERRLAYLAVVLTGAFFILSTVFWIVPAISNETVWRITLCASLVASLLIPTCQIPGLFLSHIRLESRFTVFKKLLLCDFASESSSTRRFVFSLPLSIVVLGAAWFVHLFVYAVALLSCLLAPEVSYWIRRTTPPLVLYLGASEPADMQLSANLISTNLIGRRIVTLLRPGQRDTIPGGYAGHVVSDAR